MPEFPPKLPSKLPDSLLKPEEKNPAKVPWYLLKNADGARSVSYTLVIVFSLLAAIWFLLGIFEKLGPVNVRPFSGSETMAVLSVVYALYFGRRHQELKAGETEANSEPSQQIIINAPVSPGAQVAETILTD